MLYQPFSVQSIVMVVDAMAGCTRVVGTDLSKKKYVTKAEWQNSSQSRL